METRFLFAKSFTNAWPQMLRRQVTALLFGLALLLTVNLTATAQSFVHPGIWHKQSDLDRMKYMVQAGKDPWKGSYDLLRADAKSSYNYVVRGLNYTSVSRAGDHNGEFESDTRAAYLNALMWYITGDQRHAAKAIQCLNAWSYLTNYSATGTPSLDAGMYTSLLVNAAEIINHTSAGWAAADVVRFKAMLVYPGYSTTTVPTGNKTFYWTCYMGDPGRHGNQDLYGIKALMEIGIFLDNRIIYDRGLRYLKSQPHRADDLPYASGPGITGSLVFKNSYNGSYNYANGTSVPDYIYNGAVLNYVWENGQCQESSRDQGHAMLGMGCMAEAAEVAWNQGDDLYSIGRKRILKGLEYTLRYNVSVSNTYADQPTPWEPTVASGEFIRRFDRTGRWESLRINPFNDQDTTLVQRGRQDERACWELPLAHYLQRMELPADSVRWTTRARDSYISRLGYEQSGAQVDHPGWGALTDRRAALSPGDPVAFSSGQIQYRMNVLPGTVEAENFDSFILGGQGKTYNDLSAANSGGQYRTNEGVDLATSTDTGGGYQVTDMQPGEWLSYTVAVPVDGNYSLAIRYSAANAGGAIRFELDGIDKTGNVAVPFGGSNSTGVQDWKDFTVASSVALQAGVQSLRIYVTGAGGAYNLNNFSVSLLAPTTPPAAPNNLSAQGGYSQILLTWDAAVSATSYSVKRATASGGPYALLTSGLTTTSYTDPGLANGTTYYYVVSATNAIGEGANSLEDSATPSVNNALVEDAFETNNGPVTGRTPELATVAGRVFQSSPVTSIYAHAVAGGVARLLGNIGEVVDLRSYPGYAKPTFLNISATFDEGTLANNTPARPARGVYIGFWSALVATGNESATNMRGIYVNPENGQLQLWNGSATPTVAALQSLPYQGTWVGGTQQHTLSYTVNTTNGNISECVLDGATYQWNRTTIFTDANTSYAGFGVSTAASTQYGNIQYFRVKDNLVANEVIRTPQSITFAELADQNLGNTDFAPGATTTSGLPITYTSSNPGVATITAGGLIHLVASGSTTITAAQAGNSTFEFASSVSRELFVLNPAGLNTGVLVTDEFTTASATVIGRTPEVATVLGRTYQKANTITPNATSVSAGFARMTSNVGAAVDIRSGAGYAKPTEMSLSFTFNQGTLVNNSPVRPARGCYLGFWSALPTSGTESIGNLRGIFVNPENGQLQLWNGSATPTVAALQSLAYQGTWVGGTRSHTLSYTVNTTTGNISNCVLDGASYAWAATTIFTDANTAFAGFGGAGSSSTQVGNVDRFNLSSKAEQVITFGPLPTKQVGAADFAPGATTSSNLALTYTSSNAAVATIVNGQIHVVGAGTAAITATQAGSADFLAATSRTRTLTVNKLTQTIAFTPIATQPYGNGSFQVPLAASATSGLPVSFTVVSGPATVSGSTLTISGLGAVTVKATQAGDATYLAAAEAPQTFQVVDVTSPVVVTQNVTLTLDASGSATLTAAQIDNGSSDNDRIVSYNVDRMLFDCASVAAPTTVTLTVTDASNNVGSATALVTVIDTQAPALTAPAALTISADAGQCSAGNVVLGSATVSDNCAGALVRNDAPATFPIGATTVTWTGTDVSGNATTATQTVTVIDSEAPAMVAPAALLIGADAGQCSASNVGLGNPAASDNCGGVVISNNAPTIFPLGNTTVLWTATDAAGLTATATQVVTVTDNERPVLVLPTTLVLNASASACDAVASFTATATDNCTGATVVTSHASGSTFPVGTTTVQATATDAAGNISTGSFTVTVNDATAPTVITQNITIPLVGGVASIVASQINNGSFDACGIQSAVLSQTSFDCSKAGANTVVLTVTDVHGNVGTGTAVVTVEDRTAPVVRTRNVTIALAGGIATITTADVDNGSSDNCGLRSLQLDRTTFDCSSLNTAHTVTLTATDVHGNVSTGSASVTITGSKPTPTIAVSPATITTGKVSTLYIGYGPQSATLTAMGGANYAWSPARGLSTTTGATTMFTPTAEGTYILTVTAMSSSGCSATTSVTFVVEDVRCGNNNDKIQVCHNGQTICVASSALNAHLGHGDKLGTCAPAARQAASTTSISGPLELAVYPNPAADRATLFFRAPADGNAQVLVYNALGQRVANLYEGTVTSGQAVELTLKGEALAAGVYQCRLVLNGQSVSQRLLIAR